VSPASGDLVRPSLTPPSAFRFDAHEEEDIYLVDPHVTDSGFHELAHRCANLAPRFAAVLEGGYNLDTLPRLVRAALDGFNS